jgi:hypothetical protein
MGDRAPHVTFVTHATFLTRSVPSAQNPAHDASRFERPFLPFAFSIFLLRSAHVIAR